MENHHRAEGIQMHVNTETHRKGIFHTMCMYTVEMFLLLVNKIREKKKNLKRITQNTVYICYFICDSFGKVFQTLYLGKRDKI